mgnify:CR=1 FL=1
MAFWSAGPRIYLIIRFSLAKRREKVYGKEGETSGFLGSYLRTGSSCWQKT